ncbi:hypothetical protein ACHAXR_004637 [Thalassiosira sp. AJA248-18]
MSATTVPTTDRTSDNDSATVTRPSCCFIVTGFGPFGGVPDNPTSVLIRRLQEDDSTSTRTSRNIHETHILETSADFVREKIDHIYGQLKSNERNRTKDGSCIENEAKLNDGVDKHEVDGANVGGSNTNEVKTVIVLHLGVNYRGRHFQLEQSAYNDATFRIPDERGYKPNRECILESKEETSIYKWGERLDTKLDVHKVCHELQKYGEDVKVSRDPGRFVCNYTYCLSLDRCHGKGEMHQALFIHVPPFSVVPEDRQLDFILRVMETIEQQI